MNDETATERLTQRSVRTFVLRQGRMTPSQKEALATLYPQWGIPWQPDTMLDFAALFGRKAPVVLEIGSGMGDATAAIAEANPDIDFIAVEVHGPGVGNLLKLIAARGLTNLRVLRHDAIEVLERVIPAESLSAIHLFFPDPWPKKQHHKRRIVQPPIVALMASRLKPGGYLHCATDWEEYAHWMLDVLSSEPLLANDYPEHGFATPRPAWRPRTKFEQRGTNLGHGVWDLLFRRKPQTEATSAPQGAAETPVAREAHAQTTRPPQVAAEAPTTAEAPAAAEVPTTAEAPTTAEVPAASNNACRSDAAS